MKKGALASGALALGGSAIGSAAAQETGGGETGEADQTVLMLHPDAVEDAEFTVESGEVSWSPIEAGGAGTPEETETETETETQINQNGGETTGTEAATDGGETAPGGGGGGESYATYMIEYGFSASHVAPVFVPQDVDLSEGDERQLGEIQEIVEEPGSGTAGDTDGGETGGMDGGETGGAGQEGEPLYVRVGLQEGGAPTETETPDETGTVTETETATETETETETETTTTTEGDGGGGLFG